MYEHLTLAELYQIRTNLENASLTRTLAYRRIVAAIAERTI